MSEDLEEIIDVDQLFIGILGGKPRRPANSLAVGSRVFQRRRRERMPWRLFAGARTRYAGTLSIPLALRWDQARSHWSGPQCEGSRPAILFVAVATRKEPLRV